jgi:uncharacterized protein (DUF486 family)
MTPVMASKGRLMPDTTRPARERMVYSAAQLKTMQEVITLLVFAAFSVLYLREPLQWNHAVGFALIAGGAFFVFHKW